MAEHIWYDRMAPDAPTKEPAMISSLFDTIIPAKTPEKPEHVFKTQMTTGMSAPPIAIENMIPHTADVPVAQSNKKSPKYPP